MSIGELQATGAGEMLCHDDGVLMAECCCEGCELSLSTGPQFRFYPGQIFGETKQVTLINTGEVPVAWTSSLSGNSEAIDYTTIDPDSGSLNPGISEVLDVEVDPAGNLLVNGTYDGVLTVEGNDGGCDATAVITVMIATLFASNIKYILTRQWGGPLNRTFIYKAPGYWVDTIAGYGTMYLWINSNGARARYRDTLGVYGPDYSPYFDVALRYSDGYPSGESTQWAWAMPSGAWLQVTLGPDVW